MGFYAVEENRTYGVTYVLNLHHPAAFYFAFSLLIFQIATLFWDIRVALSLFDVSV